MELQRLDIWFDRNEIIHESLSKNGRHVLFADVEQAMKGKDALITIGDDTEHELEEQIIILKADHEQAMKEKDGFIATFENHLHVADKMVDRLKEQIAALKAENEALINGAILSCKEKEQQAEEITKLRGEYGSGY